MTPLPIRSFRMKLRESLRRVERGEVLAITIHGRPIAEIHPTGTAARLATVPPAPMGEE